jgi:hypothetical protein
LVTHQVPNRDELLFLRLSTPSAEREEEEKEEERNPFGLYSPG